MKKKKAHFESIVDITFKTSSGYEYLFRDNIVFKKKENYYSDNYFVDFETSILDWPKENI